MGDLNEAVTNLVLAVSNGLDKDVSVERAYCNLANPVLDAKSMGIAMCDSFDRALRTMDPSVMVQFSHKVQEI